MVNVDGLGAGNFGHRNVDSTQREQHPNVSLLLARN